MEELKKTLAFIYNNQGQESMTKKELELAMAMTQRWFSSSEANGLIDFALREGLLEETDQGCVLSYDPKEMDIPFDFKPSDRVLKLLLVKDPFKALIKRIEENSSMERKKIMANVNRIQQDLNVTIEVAAIMVAKEMDVEVDDFYPLVQERIYELASREKSD